MATIAPRVSRGPAPQAVLRRSVMGERCAGTRPCTLARAVRRAAIACALAMIPAAAQATTDWVSLGGTTTTQGAVDRASITTQKKQLQAWALFRFTAPQHSPGGEYRSQKSLSYFKCAERTIAYVEHLLYASEDGGGEAVYTVISAPAEIAFAKPEPDTMGERIVEFVCAEDRKKRSKTKP